MLRSPLSLRARLGDFLFGRPFVRRLSWHARRITGAMDRRFLFRIVITVLVITVLLALLVLVVEGKPVTLNSLWEAINWSIHAVFGKGDSTYLTTIGGFIVSWVVVLFGAALVGIITAGFVAVVIDYLLKEGQGMGAAGFRGHIVVCGWNATARELVNELRSDDYKLRVVLINNSERNPAGEGVYFVKGDPTSATDLGRAGIADASAAIVFPVDDTPDSDMRSILTVMAIESVAPEVRTVVSVNNPDLVEHFHRAHVDEVLVTSRLASRLLARAALYPGLTDLVTDMVSGGKGSELYRVMPPVEYVGLSVDEVSRRLRADHRATLVAVVRGDDTMNNPPADLFLRHDDDVVVVAESLGLLTPAAGFIPAATVSDRRVKRIGAPAPARARP